MNIFIASLSNTHFFHQLCCVGVNVILLYNIAIQALTDRFAEMETLMKDLQFQVRAPFDTGSAEDQEHEG